MNKGIYCIIVFFLAMTLHSCGTSNGVHKTPFELDKASYQSWKLSDNSSGKNIEITVSNVGEGVTFNQLIFERQLVSVETIDQNDGTLLIKATTQQGQEIIEGKDQNIVNKPDQLIYSVNGKDSFIQLTDWERKPTVIR